MSKKDESEHDLPAGPEFTYEGIEWGQIGMAALRTEQISFVCVALPLIDTGGKRF